MADSISSVRKVSNAAQKELQAFLGAVTEIFGESRTQRAGEFWLEALENFDGVVADTEKFFRRVTIQAANQLAKDSWPRLTSPIRAN